MDFANMNIGGRVATVPELLTGDSDQAARLTFNLAVKGRSRRGTTSFFHIVVFGPYAETMANMLEKGQTIAVLGEPQQNTFKRTDGSSGERFELLTDFIALGPKSSKNQAPMQRTVQAANAEVLMNVLNQTEAGRAILAAVGQTTSDVAPKVEVPSPQGEYEGEMDVDVNLPW